MQFTEDLICDGCGQRASAEHVARRLQRLEWATRYRPVHIGTLLLGVAAPRPDEEFFYSPEGAVAGEAAYLAAAAGVATELPKGQQHSTFQRSGFFAASVLECPFEGGAARDLTELLAKRLPAAVVRIRRSLRPKKVVLISALLESFVEQLREQLKDCRIILNEERAFRLDGAEGREEAELLRRVLASTAP